MNLIRRKPPQPPRWPPIESKARGLDPSKTSDAPSASTTQVSSKNKKRAQALAQYPSSLLQLTAEDFEIITAELLEAMGFDNVFVLGGSGDFGVDIRAEWRETLPTGHTLQTFWAVQCKRTSSRLSQHAIQAILNAAIEPRQDIFPILPTFFLIVTASRLSTGARSLIESANLNRRKYGSHFLVWEGERMWREILERPKLFNSFQSKVTSKEVDVSNDTARLTVFFDGIKNAPGITFVYDAPGEGITLAERTELSEPIDEVTRPYYHRESSIQEIGVKVWDLIPKPIREQLSKRDGAYVRLASNDHTIPFEIAFDPERDRLLGYRTKIGRILYASPSTPLQFSSAPSILLAGAPTKPGSQPLPGAQREIEMLATLLSSQGFNVNKIIGEELTSASLLKSLTDNSYNIIHLATSSYSKEIELSDGTLPLKSIGPIAMKGSFLFFSTIVRLSDLHELSQHAFGAGASAVIGFNGPVPDGAIGDFAFSFYGELSAGRDVGSALHVAKSAYMRKFQDDLSWASAVLFGDPTLKIRLSLSTT